MKIMFVGQRIRARHGLTSSSPRGRIVLFGTRGVVTKVLDSPFGPQLYDAEFEVTGRVVETVVVQGVSIRDIAPVRPAHRQSRRELRKAS